jgi:hypothetical protein
MRVTVRVENSGSLKSGIWNSRPIASNFDAKKAALEDRAEEANP